MYFEAKSTLNSNYCKNIKHYLSVFGIVIKVFFKVFFAWKYIKIILLFFIFLKFTFNFGTSNLFKNKN